MPAVCAAHHWSVTLIHIDAAGLAETIAVDELRLHRPERRHAAELFGLLSDPGLYTHIGGYPGWSIDDLTARGERLESGRSWETSDAPVAG